VCHKATQTLNKYDYLQQDRYTTSPISAIHHRIYVRARMDCGGNVRPAGTACYNRRPLFRTKEEPMKYHPLSRCFVILLLLSFGLSGCGGGGEDDGDDAEERSSETTDQDEATEGEEAGEGEEEGES
jgi:hypothetical protein